jgi:hypothetical protein
MLNIMDISRSENLLFCGTPFCSIQFRIAKLTYPRHSASHGKSTLFRGITKAIPSLFRGIFSERICDCNPSLAVNAKAAAVLGSIPASADTVESEERQLKQC